MESDDEDLGSTADVILELMCSTQKGRRIYPLLKRHLHLITLGPYLGPVGASGFIIKGRSREEIVLYVGDESKMGYALFRGRDKVLETEDEKEMIRKIEEII